jgi:hypothetical protein
MSSNTFKKAVERELQKLNEEIDNRIVKGFSYIRESRRHKSLLKQLDCISKKRNAFHFFRQSYNYISAFLL